MRLMCSLRSNVTNTKTQQGSWKRRHNSKLGEQQEKLFVRLKPKAAAANVTHRKVATKEKRDQSFITTAGVM